MPEYDISFRIELASDPRPSSGYGEDWMITEKVNRGGAHRAPPVYIPANATIIKILPPLEDGYYIRKGSSLLYNRYRGQWFYKTTSPRNWNTAGVRDHIEDLIRLGPVIDEGA